jgi:hypothetical protein
MKNKNLISISGKTQAGKDTTGKIIQWLTSNEKSMSFDSFNLITERWYNHNDYIIKKYAFKLKQIASILLNVPVEKFEDQSFKDSILGPEWNRMKGDYVGEIINDKTIHQITVREFLQKLGTEAMRNQIHPNTWENALFADYEEKFANKGISGFHDPIRYKRSLGFPNWVITDTRFPNELQAVKDRNGITIRINRPSLDQKINSINLHLSETALDNAEFDHVIENDADIPALIKKVKTILIEENIIIK